MKISVNNRLVTINVDESKPLLWVLREDLKLPGTKYGCGAGICGCCSVLIDGALARSCILAIGSIEGSEVTTIEGLDDALGRKIKRAWLELGVSQCGYCQPGQIISAYALLSGDPNPTDQQIDDGMLNLCRCGTYDRIRAAIGHVDQGIPDESSDSAATTLR